MNMVSPYVGNLLGQVDTLGEGQGARLDGTLHINVLNLLAEVCLGADKADQAVLDLQRDICALLDRLGHDAGRGNYESLATNRQQMLAQFDTPYVGR